MASAIGVRPLDMAMVYERNTSGSRPLEYAVTDVSDDELTVTIRGPEGMAASDVFGQWLTVELCNLGADLDEVMLSVAVPAGFLVQTVRTIETAADPADSGAAATRHASKAENEAWPRPLHAGSRRSTAFLVVTHHVSPGRYTIDVTVRGRTSRGEVAFSRRHSIVIN